MLAGTAPRIDLIAPSLRPFIVPIGSVREHPRNPNAGDVEDIAASLDTFAQYSPIVVQASTGYIVKGNHTHRAAVLRRWTVIAAHRMDLDDTTALAILAGDNRHSERGQRDAAKLTTLLAELEAVQALTGTGYDAADLDDLLDSLDRAGRPYVAPGGATVFPGEDNDGREKFAAGDGKFPSDAPTLAARFVVPPFTVLDARQGYWRDRKRAWQARGVFGVRGREAGPDGRERRLAFVQGGRPYAQLDPISRKILQRAPGTSVFDPVLCEVVYRWFAPPGGTVVDPFAGECTKGLVAGLLGLRYTGVELRPEQVAENEGRRGDVGLTADQARWITADAATIPALGLPGAYDLLFTSPPYYDLETYSSRARDISNFGTYAEFLAWYARIFAAAVELVAPDRFVVVKIGDVRDPATGALRNLVGDTLSIFTAMGLRLYNHAILITIAGSLPLRVANQFKGNRKLGTSHQHVLAFFKGDPRRIKAIFPETVEFGLPLDDDLWAATEADGADGADGGEGDDGDGLGGSGDGDVVAGGS